MLVDVLILVFVSISVFVCIWFSWFQHYPLQMLSTFMQMPLTVGMYPAVPKLETLYSIVMM